jgi:hypothetical protein
MCCGQAAAAAATTVEELAAVGVDGGYIAGGEKEERNRTLQRFAILGRNERRPLAVSCLNLPISGSHLRSCSLLVVCSARFVRVCSSWAGKRN